MYDDRCENHYKDGTKIFENWKDCCVTGGTGISKTEVLKMEVSHLRIEKVENGFLYTLYEYDDESIPSGVRAQAGKIWVSGNDAAEIGRTVLKIFGANPEKTLTPKSEG